MDLLTLNSMIDKMSENILTSLGTTEILGLAKDVAKYNLVDTTGFPFELQTANISAGIVSFRRIWHRTSWSFTTGSSAVMDIRRLPQYRKSAIRLLMKREYSKNERIHRRSCNSGI